jgi:transposase, IS30 family
MHFRRQSAIMLTLQERRSRLTLAGQLHSRDATDTAIAIIDKLAALPPTAVQTITHDNGGEFAGRDRRHRASRLLLRSA